MACQWRSLCALCDDDKRLKNIVFVCCTSKCSRLDIIICGFCIVYPVLCYTSKHCFLFSLSLSLSPSVCISFFVFICDALSLFIRMNSRCLDKKKSSRLMMKAVFSLQNRHFISSLAHPHTHTHFVAFYQMKRNERKADEVQNCWKEAGAVAAAAARFTLPFLT